MKIGKHEVGSIYNTDVTIVYDPEYDLIELEWHTEGGTYNRIQVGTAADGLEAALDVIEEISQDRHDCLCEHLSKIRRIIML